MGTEGIIGLAFVGYVLILCEVFVPGGVIGTVGAVLLAAGIVAGFFHGPVFGFWMLIGSLVIGVLGFFAWIKYFPRTAIGKKMVLSQDAAEWHGFDDAKQELLGKEGVTHGPLHPAGTAMIDGKRVDVVTRGEMVEAHQKVRVIKVEGNRVVVDMVPDEDTGDESDTSEA